MFILTQHLERLEDGELEATGTLLKEHVFFEVEVLLVEGFELVGLGAAQGGGLGELGGELVGDQGDDVVLGDVVVAK